MARDVMWLEAVGVHPRGGMALAAYTFKGGNIWPVVLIVTLLAPWLAALARGLVE